MTIRGLSFYTIEDTGALSNTPYKTIRFDYPLILVRGFPNGKILAISQQVNAVYIVDIDDSITQIATIASKYLEAEPGNYTTFPELFQS